MVETDNIERRVLHSTLASYGAMIVRLGVALVSRLILARLILPEAHGLYELAFRLVVLASAFRDLGLPHQLMRDERKPYGTVLAFSLGMGLLLTLGLVALAPMFAFLDPDLPNVLRAMAVWVLLDGLITVCRTYFDRQLRIREIAGSEMLRSLLVGAIAIGLAWLDFGVWSFVIAELAATATFAALLWRRARSRMPLELHLTMLGDLLRQSRYLFGVWAAFQVLTYIDIYIVEIFGTTVAVGHYSRAYMIAFLVPMVFAPRSLLPALVAYSEDDERFAEALRLGTLFLLFWEVLAAYFLFLNADKVILVLLGRNWEEAVPLLKVLCFVPLLEVFTDTGGEALKVKREDRLWLTIVLLNLVSLVTFGVALGRRWGALGMALANFCLVGNLVMAWRMFRLFPGRQGKLFADLAQVYLIPLPFFAAAAALFPSATWSRVGLSAVAGLLAAAILAFRFYPSYRRFFAAARE